MLQPTKKSGNKVTEYWWLIIPIVIFSPWLIPIIVLGGFILFFGNKPLFDKLIELLGLGEYVKKIEKEINKASDNKELDYQEGDFNKNGKVDEEGFIYSMKQESTKEYLARLNNAKKEKEEQKKMKKVTGTLNRSKDNKKSSIWDDYESVSEAFKRNKR